MQVYKNYISKHADKTTYIKSAPNPLLQNIIVIPCYNEKDIVQTLKSLKECQSPNAPTEVIIVINTPEGASKEIIAINKKTQTELKQWEIINNTNEIKFHTIYIENIPKKIAGAGYARKIGMDEAVKRFQWVSNSNGIITSLDADSTVAENYLVEIEKLFIKNPKTNACSIYFEHPLSGNEFSQTVYDKIAEYELYMRYYSLSLKFTGFPYFYHTIGSGFAVKTLTYCKQGGMNKKQAGEDFYFLQKIMPLGNYYYLKSTVVYPSPRPSLRVPFGTGPVINNAIKNPEKELETYKFEVFLNLRKLFSKVDDFFKLTEINLGNYSFHPSINDFLLKNNFSDALKEINANTSNIKSFRKRFLQWFDAFRIIKYINFAHENFYSKLPVRKAAKDYLKNTNSVRLYNDDIRKLLSVFRQIELNN